MRFGKIGWEAIPEVWKARRQGKWGKRNFVKVNFQSWLSGYKLLSFVSKADMVEQKWMFKVHRPDGNHVPQERWAWDKE